MQPTSWMRRLCHWWAGLKPHPHKPGWHALHAAFVRAGLQARPSTRLHIVLTTLVVVLAHAALFAAEGGEGAHEESLWPLVGKIVNFAILAGTVFYFARKPLAGYIVSRRAQVRSDLVAAEAMKTTAAAQIAEMDAKLAALPAELEALKARGRQEIAAEQQRIRQLADAERARLLEQAAREIEQRTRLAERELVEHAANLAVEVARMKIQTQITDADQARLVDRYLAEVKTQ